MEFLDCTEADILLPRYALRAVFLPGASVYGSSHSYITGQVKTINGQHNLHRLLSYYIDNLDLQIICLYYYYYYYYYY